MKQIDIATLIEGSAHLDHFISIIPVKTLLQDPTRSHKIPARILAARSCIILLILAQSYKFSCFCKKKGPFLARFLVNLAYFLQEELARFLTKILNVRFLTKILNVRFLQDLVNIVATRIYSCKIFQSILQESLQTDIEIIAIYLSIVQEYHGKIEGFPVIFDGLKSLPDGKQYQNLIILESRIILLCVVKFDSHRKTDEGKGWTGACC